MLQNGTIMPPKKHYYASKMHYYAGIMLDAPHIVLCSKLCRHNVSTPTPKSDFSWETGNQAPQLLAASSTLVCSKLYISYLGLVREATVEMGGSLVADF